MTWLSVLPKNPEIAGSKIAPGMEVAYVVKFTPEERADLVCEIQCMTEREKFTIPVHAIGPRGESRVSRSAAAGTSGERAARGLTCCGGVPSDRVAQPS